jgi:hypothetical protein
MTSFSVGQSLGLVLGTWVLWKIFNIAFPKDPFSNIAGPPSDSLLTGGCTQASNGIILSLTPGNIEKLMNKDGWENHQGFAKKCREPQSILLFLGAETMIADGRVFSFTTFLGVQWSFWVYRPVADDQLHRGVACISMTQRPCTTSLSRQVFTGSPIHANAG